MPPEESSDIRKDLLSGIGNLRIKNACKVLQNLLLNAGLSFDWEKDQCLLPGMRIYDNENCPWTGCFINYGRGVENPT